MAAPTFSGCDTNCLQDFTVLSVAREHALACPSSQQKIRRRSSTLVTENYLKGMRLAYQVTGARKQHDLSGSCLDARLTMKMCGHAC
jgi:hypothetical protein